MSEIILSDLPEIRQRGVDLKKIFPWEWNSWRAMHERCRNKKYRRYDLYGGRGITVCEQWRSFRNFLKDMGRKPTKKHSIDRKESTGNYEPSNCKWSTQAEQMVNTSKNVFLDFDGKHLAVSEWARLKGVTPGGLMSRVRSGWSAEDALTIPFREADGTPGIERVFELNGVTDNLTGWARRLGISAAGLHRMLKDGLSIEQASRHVPGRRRTSRLIEAFGEAKTASEWSLDVRCVVTAATLLKRLEAGWDAERSISEPSKDGTIMCNGQTKTIKEWAEITGLKECTIIWRIRRRGWSPEKSLSMPKGQTAGNRTREEAK